MDVSFGIKSRRFNDLKSMDVCVRFIKIKFSVVNNVECWHKFGLDLKYIAFNLMCHSF